MKADGLLHIALEFSLKLKSTKHGYILGQLLGYIPRIPNIMSILSAGSHIPNTSGFCYELRTTTLYIMITKTLDSGISTFKGSTSLIKSKYHKSGQGQPN